MAYVQSASSGTAALFGPPYVANPYTLAFLNPSTKGNSIVVAVVWTPASGGSGSIAVTDSEGNSYTQLVVTTGQECWYANGITGGGSPITVSVTYTGTDGIQTIQLAIHEDTAFLAAATVDTHAIGTATSPAVATASITSGYGPDFLFAFATTFGANGLSFAPGIPVLNFAARESNGSAAGLLYTWDLQTSMPGGTGFSLSIAPGVSITHWAFSVALIAFKVQISPLLPAAAWLIINEPASVNPTLPGYTDRSALMHFGKGKGTNKFTNTLQQRGTATIPLMLKAANTYDPTLIEGCQIFEYDVTPGPVSTLVWAGSIEKVNLKSMGLKGDRVATLTCVSLRQAFDKLRVPPQLFQYQSGGAIFTSLFNSVAGGVPVTLGAIVGTGSGSSGTGANFVINTLDLASSPFQRLSEVFDQIAQACQCVWDIDLPTLTVYLKPPSTTAAPYSIAPRQLLYDSVTWETNRADYRNWQALQVAASAFGQSSELFACNSNNLPPMGSQTQSFTLKHPAQTISKAWLTNNTQNKATGTFSSLPANGDTITIGYPQSGSIYNWAPNAPYTVDQVIVDPANHIQIVKTQGTSGGSQPSWNDTGGTTTDGPGSPEQTGFGGSIVWQDLGVSGPGGIGSTTYTLVDVLDNTQWGQVLIPPTGSIDQMCQNFADAINSNSAVQGGISGSPTFSAPTWENPLVNAGATSGGNVITIFNKAAGAGYISALSATSTAFSWSASQTSGGVTTFNTIELQIAQNGQSNSANLYYTPGSNVAALASDPQTAHTSFIQIQYQAAGSAFIIVENSAEVLLRAQIETGNGLYMQSISDTSITTNTEGLQFVQAILAAFDSVPVSFSFTAYPPGLLPGQLLTIAITAPSYLATLLNGTWFVQEVSAELMPIVDQGSAGGARWMNQATAPGGGHYRYTVTLINESQIQSWLAFWEQMAGGGSGGGSAGLVAGGSASPDGANATATGGSGINLMGTTGNLTPVLGSASSYTQQAGPLTGAITIEAPTGPGPGAFFMVQIIQPSSGSAYGVTWNSFYKGLSGFILAQILNTQASFLFQVNAAGTAAQLMQPAQNGWPIT